MDSRIRAAGDRFGIIKQAILRNENFSPRPFGAANREKTLKVCLLVLLSKYHLPLLILVIINERSPRPGRIRIFAPRHVDEKPRRSSVPRRPRWCRQVTTFARCEQLPLRIFSSTF